MTENVVIRHYSVKLRNWTPICMDAKDVGDFYTSTSRKSEVDCPDCLDSLANGYSL